MTQELPSNPGCAVRERAERILLLSFGELAQRWLARRREARSPSNRPVQKIFVQRSKKSLQDGFRRV